jgi:hypothetical protein
VAIAAVSSTSAIPAVSLRAAVSRAPILKCYREAVHRPGSPAATATLRLKIDMSGYVTDAALEPAGEGAPFAPELRACVEKAARGLRVRDVDTGEASAAVTLRFTPP